MRYKKQNTRITSLIIAVLILILLNIINLGALNAMYQRSKYENFVIGIKEEICKYENDCYITYNYSLEEKNYYCTIINNKNEYPETTKIYYDENNHNDCVAQIDIKPVVGPLMLIPIIIIIILPYTQKEKPSAAYLANDLFAIGKLYKKLPYTIERKGNLYSNKRYDYIVVEYTDKNGNILRLQRKFQGDYNQLEENKTVDLLIDENHTKSYYIDFDIEKY